MKNGKILLIVISFLLLCIINMQNCSNNTEMVPLNFQKFDGQKWYDSLTYIPLVDSSLVNLGSIRKVRFWEDKIFVLYEKDEIRSISVYDREGKLLRSRSGVEEGKHKFFRVNDIQISDSKIYLCDGFTSQMHIFTIHLEFIKSIALPIEEGIKSFSFISRDKIIIRPEKISTIGSSVLLIDLNEPSKYFVVTEFEKYSSMNTSQYPLTYVNNFSKNDVGDILYVDIFMNKIFVIDSEGSVKSQISGDAFKQIWVSDEDVKFMETRDVYEQHKYLRNISKIYYYSNVIEIGSYYHLSFVKHGVRYFMLVDAEGMIIKQAKLNLLENTRNTINGGPVLGNLLGSSLSNKLVFIQNPEEIKLWQNTFEHLDNKNGVYSRMVASLNEKCQNVLVLASLKIDYD